MHINPIQKADWLETNYRVSHAIVVLVMQVAKSQQQRRARKVTVRWYPALQPMVINAPGIKNNRFAISVAA